MRCTFKIGLAHGLGLIILSLFISGCGSDSAKEPVVPVTISGFWLGTTTENALDTITYALFHEGAAYILQEDEIQLGQYTIKENGHNDLLMDVYPYIIPDTPNFFFVGTNNTTELQLDAFLATPLDLVVNYNTDTYTRAGHIVLVRDVEQELEISFERTVGNWNTLDSTMSIGATGGFSGWHSSTCFWEGDITLLTTHLFSLNIGRKNCDEFNVLYDKDAPPNGLALIDGNGILHFIAIKDTEILWMRFDPVVIATIDTPTETEGDAVVEDEVVVEDDVVAP